MTCRMFRLSIIFTLIAAFAVFSTAQTEISIWGWRADGDLWQAVEAALQEAGHDINIRYEQTLATEYDSRMALALQSGEGPDIVYTRRLPGQRTQGLIDSGLIVALDEDIDFSHFTDTTLAYIRSGEQTWGVPFANQIIGIFYNQRLYDQFGLEEPATWDELISNAQVLQENGITPFSIAGREAWTLAMQHAMTGVSSPGPEWIRQLQAGEVSLLDDEFVDINQRLNDLSAFYQPNFMASSTEDQDADFAFEQAAMVFYGIWAVRQWLELNPELEVGYFPVPPVSDDQEPHAYVYMDGSFALNTNARNPELALEVLRFTASPEFGTIFADVLGELPAVTGATLPEDNPMLQEGAAVAEASAAPYTYWVGSPFETGVPSLYDILSPGMQEMYLGDISPEELAQEAHEGISSWYEPLQ